MLERGSGPWQQIVDRMKGLFGVTLHEPRYIQERSEIVMSFRTAEGVTLDLSASGRGQQQILLLLAHMAANPFLDPLFRKFHAKLGIPDLMRRTDYHTLAPFVPANELDREVIEKLDAIAEVVARAHPSRRRG